MGLLEDVQNDLKLNCEGLVAIADDQGGVTIVGGHPVRDLEGNEVTCFAIRMELSKDFPKALPLVYDVADRIPICAERHMFPDGRCCIGVPAALIDRLSRKYSISEFVNGPMRGYFIGQALVEHGGKWPYGEMRHDHEGLLDYWCERFGVASPESALRLLFEASRGSAIKKDELCPCGSKTPLQSCHGARLQQYRELYGLNILQTDAIIIFGMLREINEAQRRAPAIERMPNYYRC